MLLGICVHVALLQFLFRYEGQYVTRHEVREQDNTNYADLPYDYKEFWQITIEGCPGTAT